ncbi:methyltransferase domain-containing protein [uncultured Roseobacter sp.]|uniref:class I SAM-dependent DNA methyltransferase n=1 Tax=uncultured Roseobacter sp. TaxID=114847 RepID=UPI002603CD9D|nr:methyltransferase domain-containing protein [uncultured Roseobacter sp.]
MAEPYLTRVYGSRHPDDTRALYDDWSDGYEAEVRENGYVTPGRCAEALAKHVPDLTAPVLDFGCGTGLSGLALKLAGFAALDGVDISEEMLAKARAKRLYRALALRAPGDGVPDLTGYAAVAAIGVIGAGAAPMSVFDDLMRGLRKGGFLVLSLNDHALADRCNEARICEWTDCGAARLLFREHGPHLPGINLKSTVYVLEKM